MAGAGEQQFEDAASSQRPLNKTAWKWIEMDRVRDKGPTGMPSRRGKKGRDRGPGMKWVCMQANWPAWEEAEENDDG
eukprot:4690423-Prorocentrum_lima.AAC.1